jgi:hypothetical protein
MPGEEWLVRYPSDDKTGESHGFVWETLGELNNPLKPATQLEIGSGGDDPNVSGVSSLDTGQMLQLYESIVKTIRLRPVEEKPEANPEQKPKAEGEAIFVCDAGFAALVATVWLLSMRYGWSW